ncbi:MAG: DUF3467 domain-containing protein [Planctomycetia bacterium]|nr:DUF3467 domain-containing protein [Planctomycetia bacterium]
MATTPTALVSAATPHDSAPVPPQPVKLDESKLVAAYANFCRVTGTPEELIIDFGLNAHPMGSSETIAVEQRLVLNYYTAKRLLQALGMSVARHEQVFGQLETNVMKRAEKK